MEVVLSYDLLRIWLFATKWQELAYEGEQNSALSNGITTSQLVVTTWVTEEKTSRCLEVNDQWGSEFAFRFSAWQYLTLTKYIIGQILWTIYILLYHWRTGEFQELVLEPALGIYQSFNDTKCNTCSLVHVLVITKREISSCRQLSAQLLANNHFPKVQSPCNRQNLPPATMPSWPGQRVSKYLITLAIKTRNLLVEICPF